jgi:hypothetical protein
MAIIAINDGVDMNDWMLFVFAWSIGTLVSIGCFGVGWLAVRLWQRQKK